MNKFCSATLTTMLGVGLALGAATPAQAAYGDEVAYNICQSNRGVYAYNTGYEANKLLLGPCENSRQPSNGYQDVDKIYISKADICFRVNRGNGWSGAFRGPLTLDVGEDSIYVQAETVSIDPYSLNWVCVFK
jgi:hypothetical protein